MRLIISSLLCAVLVSATVGKTSQATSQWDKLKVNIEQDFKRQRYKEAIDMLEKAMDVPMTNQELAEAYLLYTQIATKTGEYEAATFYLGKLVPLTEMLELSHIKTKALIAKLELEYHIDDTRKLLSKVKALEMQNDFPDDPLFDVGIKNIISICYIKEGKLDSALLYINQVIAKTKSLNLPEKGSNALQNKAYCLIALDRKDSVISILNQSVKMARQQGNLELQIDGLFLLGKYYQNFGPTEAALMHLDAAQLLTKEIGAGNLESRYYIALYYYEFYSSQERHEEALQWFQESVKLEDSLHREDAALKAAFSESIKTIAKQKNLLSRNQVFLSALIVGLVIIAIILFMQRRLLILRDKTAVKLKFQYEALQLQRQTLIEQKHSIENRNVKLESFLVMLEQLSDSSQGHQGDIKKTLIEVSKIIQSSLEVGRVSIWNYDAEIPAITCRVLLENGIVSTKPTTLLANDYPNYFNAITQKKLIIADDALTDPATEEFKVGYLDEYGITSMLDAPILLSGELAGIICCEHTGVKRTWETEDTIFLLAISDFISITLLNDKIRLQNESLQESNLTLEDAVKMRTMELELQNKQLAEYAFVNSHLLRSPLAKILSLTEIMKHEFSNENKQLIDAMIESADELDDIIKQIGQALYDGNHFTRAEINAMKKNLE